MEKKKGLSVILLIPTLIIGAALFKLIDFSEPKVEKPALAIVYFLAFVLCIVFIIRSTKKQTDK